MVILRDEFPSLVMPNGDPGYEFPSLVMPNGDPGYEFPSLMMPNGETEEWISKPSDAKW